MSLQITVSRTLILMLLLNCVRKNRTIQVTDETANQTTAPAPALPFTTTKFGPTEITTDGTDLNVTRPINHTTTDMIAEGILPRYRYNVSTTPVFMAIYLGIGILGMIGNFLVNVVMLKYKCLREKLTNAFVLNQSLIDFLTACFLVAAQVTDDISWAKTDLEAYLYCRLWLSKWMLWGLFIASTYNLLTLTMERYFAIVHSMLHMRFFTKTKARVMMVCVWIFGPSWTLYDLFTTNMDGNECAAWSIWPNAQFQRIFGIVVVFVQYIIPLFVLVFAYGSIIYVLHRKAGDGVGHTASHGANNRELLMIKARTNVIKTLVIVAVCFIVCWGPNQLLFLIYNTGVDVDYNSWYYHWTVMMTFLNCCVNPIIYTFKYEEFKHCLWHMLCGDKSKTPRGSSSLSDVSCPSDTTKASITDVSKVS